MSERWIGRIGSLAGVILFGAAVWLLHRELAAFRLHDVFAELRSISRAQIALAAGLTVAGYVTLTGYDALAVRWLGRRLPYPQVALASFVAYVVSHNIGLSFLGGSAVRYRLFSAFGLSPSEIARVIAFDGLTFWLGFLALAGFALTAHPLPLHGAHGFLPFSTTAPLGAALLAALAAYLGWSALRRDPVQVLGFSLPIPRLHFSLAQVAVSATDWALAAAVFAALLPSHPAVPFSTVLGAVLLSQILGVVSHVPAGLGVFEASMVLLLGDVLPGDVVLGAALAYRIVYYLFPLTCGIALLGGFEAMQRRETLSRAGGALASVGRIIVPRAFAVAVFGAGVILLTTGALPPAKGRFAALGAALPLPVIELSHFVASLVGAALLLLARGVQRRLDAAYPLSLALLAGGGVLAVAKGAHFAEAAILFGIALALLPCRSFFHRPTALLADSFSPGWTFALLFVVQGVLFLVLFAYKSVGYSSDLWWQFELDAHVSRSLRAGVGALVVLAGYAALRLMRPPPPDPAPPDEDAIARARAIADGSPDTTAQLVRLRDKALLFAEAGDAFLMYGVSRSCWVAMGDPVGPFDRWEELAWRFRETADRHGGFAAFYEVGSEGLGVYVDLGLSLYKLGEHARVPLEGFTLEGGARKALRATRNRMEREGCRFELLTAAEVPKALDELEEVSNAWLAEKRTREKRFSLGFFDRRYLAEGPVAVVRQGARIVGFANVLLAGGRSALSIDLMRHRPDAPNGVMEHLFTQLMVWGSAEGYGFFDLGMAPLSGLERRRLAPLWTRIGSLLFQHGENFYNFQGLRAFKEKFDPIWEPRYLASPGGWLTARSLTHVATLIAGGVRGVVSR